MKRQLFNAAIPGTNDLFVVMPLFLYFAKNSKHLSVRSVSWKSKIGTVSFAFPDFDGLRLSCF